MSKIPPPNYTQMPNVVLDNLQELTLAETKVVLAVCRQTFGYHREKAYLSVATIMRLTGLSDQSVKNGVEGLLKRGWIKREAKAQSFVYEMNIENVGEPPKIFGQENSASQNFWPPTPQNFTGEPPKILAPLKESTKEKTKRNIPEGSASGEEHKLFIDQWCEAYEVHFGRKYKFQGGKDGSSVKALLKHSPRARVMEIACKAWARGNQFNCKQAVTLSGLNARWNEIVNELDSDPKTIPITRTQLVPDYKQEAWA